MLHDVIVAVVCGDGGGGGGAAVVVGVSVGVTLLNLSQK